MHGDGGKFQSQETVSQDKIKAARSRLQMGKLLLGVKTGKLLKSGDWGELMYKVFIYGKVGERQMTGQEQQ